MFNPFFALVTAYSLRNMFNENDDTIPYCCNGYKHFKGLDIPCKKGWDPEESGDYCPDEDKYDEYDEDDDLDDDDI